jgi:hypothetical protein
MKNQTNDNSEILTRYLALPDQLETVLSDLSDAGLDLARAPAAWTIRQIVHHIVDADDMTKTIIKAALGQSGCTYELDWYDANNVWAETLDYAHREIAPALRLLRANHEHLAALLQHLPDAWERHVMLKRNRSVEARKITVSQLMQSQTSHALHHLEQIRETRKMHKR